MIAGSLEFSAIGKTWKPLAFKTVRTTQSDPMTGGIAKIVLPAKYHKGSVFRYRLVFKGDSWALPGTSVWQKVKFL